MRLVNRESPITVTPQRVQCGGSLSLVSWQTRIYGEWRCTGLAPMVQCAVHSVWLGCGLRMLFISVCRLVRALTHMLMRSSVIRSTAIPSRRFCRAIVFVIDCGGDESAEFARSAQHGQDGNVPLFRNTGRATAVRYFSIPFFRLTE